MTIQEIMEKIPEEEFRISASRSSGPGGQNVNKVSTRIEVRFNIPGSDSLSNDEKLTISGRLKNRINSSGDLIVKSGSERTQLRNRDLAIAKMYRIIAEALTEKPERRVTVPPASSRIERMEEKRKRGQLKRMRKGPEDTES